MVVTNKNGISNSSSPEHITDMQIEQIWKTILNNLSSGITELPTTPINKREPKWFSAITHGDSIYINNSKEHRPSCKLSMERKLTLDNFRKVYPLYLRRKNGESVSAEVTSVTVNQVYYFSLIKHLS